MSDEEVSDEPSSEVPTSSQENSKRTDDASSSEATEDYVNDDALMTTGGIFDILYMIYNDRYYWEIFKSTAMFLFALKLARECKMMRIPIREYRPFNRQ